MAIKRKSKTQPKISTSSLPDIIFMLLFFFMVVTVLRSHTKHLEVNLPAIDDPQKLIERNPIQHLYLGIDNEKTSIQLNDAFIRMDQIGAAMKRLQSSHSNKSNSHLTIALKADKNTPMRLVNQVKLELRKAETRHLNYVSVNK